jgi:hypothetical protein
MDDTMEKRRPGMKGEGEGNRSCGHIFYILSFLFPLRPVLCTGVEERNGHEKGIISCILPTDSMVPILYFEVCARRCTHRRIKALFNALEDVGTPAGRYIDSRYMNQALHSKEGELCIS